MGLEPAARLPAGDRRRPAPYASQGAGDASALRVCPTCASKPTRKAAASSARPRASRESAVTRVDFCVQG